MITITATEFRLHKRRYQDEAVKAPVAITRRGKEGVVILAAEEYLRLKRRDAGVAEVSEGGPGQAEGVRSSTKPTGRNGPLP